MIPQSLFFLVIFISTASATAEGNFINYDDLPSLVREKNGNVESARTSLDAAKERTGHLSRSFLPHIELSAGHETAKIGSAPKAELGYWSAEARINIYRGGMDRLEEKILQSQVAEAQAKSVGDTAEELKNARELYWRLTANRLLMTDMKEAIKRNGEHIESAKRRTGAGVATASDLVQFEIERTRLTHVQKRLEHEDDAISNQLSILIGLTDHKNLTLAEKFPHPPEAEFQEQNVNIEVNPEITYLKQIETSQSLKARQAGRWYLPQLDIYGKYGLPSLGEDHDLAMRKDNEFIAGVSLTLDLGQAFHRQASQTAQRLETRAVKAKRTQKTRFVQAEAHELQHNMRLFHELLHDAEADIKKASEYLRLTRNEYARGVKNGPDLQEAFTKLFEIKQRTIELHLEYEISKANLDALMSYVPEGAG